MQSHRKGGGGQGEKSPPQIVHQVKPYMLFQVSISFIDRFPTLKSYFKTDIIIVDLELFTNKTSQGKKWVIEKNTLNDLALVNNNFNLYKIQISIKMYVRPRIF